MNNICVSQFLFTFALMFLDSYHLLICYNRHQKVMDYNEIHWRFYYWQLVKALYWSDFWWNEFPKIPCVKFWHLHNYKQWTFTLIVVTLALGSWPKLRHEKGNRLVKYPRIQACSQKCGTQVCKSASQHSKVVFHFGSWNLVVSQNFGIYFGGKKTLFVLNLL